MAPSDKDDLRFGPLQELTLRDTKLKFTCWGRLGHCLLFAAAYVSFGAMQCVAQTAF